MPKQSFISDLKFYEMLHVIAENLGEVAIKLRSNQENLINLTVFLLDTMTKVRF